MPTSRTPLEPSIGQVDKTVLITGATDGLGLALARLYAARGVRLVLVGRRPLAALDDTLFTPHNYCQVDLASPGCAEVVRDFLQAGGIEKLERVVHNAALGHYGAVEAQTLTSIRELVAVNLRAPVALTHVLLPLVRRAGGRLVFIGSVAAKLATPQYAVYGASKAALEGFARSLRVELRGDVEVQLLTPGATRTGLLAKSGAPLDALGWHRYPSAERVARAMLRALEGSTKDHTFGLSTPLLAFVGRYLPRLSDRLAQRRT